MANASGSSTVRQVQLDVLSASPEQLAKERLDRRDDAVYTLEVLAHPTKTEKTSREGE